MAGKFSFFVSLHSVVLLQINLILTVKVDNFSGEIWNPI